MYEWYMSESMLCIINNLYMVMCMYVIILYSTCSLHKYAFWIYTCRFVSLHNNHSSMHWCFNNTLASV